MLFHTLKLLFNRTCRTEMVFKSSNYGKAGSRRVIKCVSVFIYKVLNSQRTMEAIYYLSFMSSSKITAEGVEKK